jgi:hypothetical protein
LGRRIRFALAWFAISGVATAGGCISAAEPCGWFRCGHERTSTTDL